MKTTYLERDPRKMGNKFYLKHKILPDPNYLVSVKIQPEFSEDLEFISEITEKSRFLMLIDDKIFMNTNHIFENKKSAEKMVADLNIEIKEIVSGLLETDDIILEAYVTDFI